MKKLKCSEYDWNEISIAACIVCHAAHHYAPTRAQCVSQHKAVYSNDGVEIIPAEPVVIVEEKRKRGRPKKRR